MVKFSIATKQAKLRHLRRVRALRRYFQDGRQLYTFDLASGHSCPFAGACFAKVLLRPDGSRYVFDGTRGATADENIRCYNMGVEGRFPQSYALRMGNLQELRTLKTPEQFRDRLLEAMPRNMGICRIHSGGDYFRSAYFHGWLLAAAARPEVLFYSYTKSIPYWLEHRALVRKTPNFVLTASYLGQHDNLIGRHRLRSVRVVRTIAEARALRLPIDHDDRHAADPTRRRDHFALLIHGSQPTGSTAAADVKRLKGKGSYSRN